MTINSNITFKVDSPTASAIDFSDRTTAINIEQRLDVGVMGRHTATILLLNNDGALTPDAGGTYSTLDWFASVGLIDGDTGTYTFNLCHGIITGFRLLDDGVNSLVQITTDDVFTCGGNAQTEISGGAPPTSIGAEQLIEAMMNGTLTSGAAFNRVGLPSLGNPSGSYVDVESVGEGYAGFYWDTSGGISVGSLDLINESIAPAGPNFIWPTIIDPSVTYAYKAALCAIWPLRNSSTAINFTFDEDATSGELPIKGVTRGFTIDRMLNSAQFTALDDGVTAQPQVETVVNSGSVDAYGERRMTAAAILQKPITANPTTNRSTLEEITSRWASQYSLPEFAVQRFSLDERTVNAAVGTSSTSEQKWAQLLDVTTGICQIGTTNFTPTGAASQTSESVVMLSRSIAINPSNLTITIECLPIAQAGGFTLDSDVLGVLDQNRLG